jgi:FKBP-type peptidyl-prolyl cis-trans isomerase FklB
MRLSSWSVLAVVLTAAVAAAATAQESTEKQPAAPTQSEETSDDNPAQPSEEKAEAPADETPAKKSPPKKGLGLKVAPDDQEDLLKKFSYMHGFSVGQAIFQQFIEQGVEFDEEVFFAAIKDGMAGKEPTMTEEERQHALGAIQKYLTEKVTANLKEKAARNKQEGAAFLAENKKKEGVKTLPSGLQYKVLKSGKGETPKKTDSVTIHYRGTFASGKEFESSYKTGKPLTFPLSGPVVAGMAEGLQLMKVGDKWQLFLPSNLAYGEQGRQGMPPNSVLVFEVELLGIEKAAKTSPLTSPLKK